jgi:hypothetical protein
LRAGLSVMAIGKWYVIQTGLANEKCVGRAADTATLIATEKGSATALLEAGR